MTTPIATRAPWSADEIRSTGKTLAVIGASAALALGILNLHSDDPGSPTPDCSTAASALTSAESGLGPAAQDTAGIPAGEKPRRYTESASAVQNPLTCEWTVTRSLD